MSLQPPVHDEELGMLPVLRIWYGDCELWADCGNCGTHLGQPIRPNQPLDTFAQAWDRHVMTAVCVARDGEGTVEEVARDRDSDRCLGCGDTEHGGQRVPTEPDPRYAHCPACIERFSALERQVVALTKTVDRLVADHDALVAERLDRLDDRV